ncbi:MULTISPECIES: YajG family lipoprotein [unclassified Photobacterium]|uniref:YajG family lipoprotein n=1 Tax=unclassified Photobacterium TaxID=2628852 RepID=UPI001EDDC95A|nr:MULTISPECIES: YajG family lipoprotein [unclassified Photobacterium]MCG3862424.1 YajG family lipoprotein [Photobacterium sp. Ph6]MCG3874077.1 YajG family lipoprotein [Photobacterium sp. Ph5]
MKKYIVIATALLLSACASTPVQPPLALTLAPVIASQTTNDLSVQVSSKDSRSHQYIAVIDSGAQNVEEFQPAENIAATFQSALTKQFASEGIKVSPSAPSNIAINIEKALVNVKQGLVKYDMNSELQIALLVTTSKGTFSKKYSARSTKQEPLKAKPEDIAQSLEKMMNSVLNEIANDGELNQYLTENL